MRRWLMLAAASCCAARAVAFSLAPTVLEIDPARRLTAETRLVNVEDTALVFTVEVMKWENVNGQDQYTPTRDVLVNPARFTLDPLGKQVIRVGVQKRAGSSELTYRVFIRQVPPTAADAATTGDAASAAIRNLLNISVPVYVAPAGAAPKLTYASAVQGQNLQLTVQNTGTRHYTYRNLQIVSDTGKTFTLASKAVLAGATFTMLLPGFAGAKVLKLTSYDAAGKPLYDQVAVP